MNRFRKFEILFFILVLSVSLEAQTSQDATKPNAEQYLRSLFLSNDSDLFRRDAEGLVNGESMSVEARAWFVSQATENGGELFFTALALLDGMKKEAPNSPWTLAARSYVTEDAEQAIWFCEKALAKDSREDILVLCTRAISGKVNTADSTELLKSFLSRHREKLEATPLGLVFEGNAIGRIGWIEAHKDFEDESTTLYDRALKMDAANPVVVAAKVRDLNARKRFKEGVDLFEHTPVLLGGETIRLIYFGAVAELAEVSTEKKAQRIEDGGQKFIERQEPSGWFVSLLVEQLEKLSKPRSEAIMDLVLKRYPNSAAAEWVKMRRITNSYDDAQSTPEMRKRIAPQLIEYLKGPQVRRDGVGMYALWVLGSIARHGEVTDDELFQVLQMNSGENAFEIVNLLADHKAHLPELEQVASEEVEKRLRHTGAVTLTWHYDLPEMGIMGQSALWGELTNWVDTLGWVYLQEGRLTNAEAKLLTAEKLLGSFVDHDMDLLTHLGRLYTVKGDFTKAEGYLGHAMSVEYSGPDDHPAIAAYKELYLRQHGTDTGLDKYMKAAAAEEHERRKANVLKERIADPKPIPPFKLTTIDGKNISSDSLKGKVVVINFWGTWCGPCKSELPEVQKFYDKYKGNPNVVFLTIDSKDSIEQVKKFIAEKKYTFPVLMEGEYLNQAKVDGFPTTWFVGRDGNKAFEKSGSSKRIVEEFSWRVEAMMESAAAAKPSEAKAQ